MSGGKETENEIEDIEKTLAAQVKKQAGLFSCRDKEAIGIAVHGKYEHPKLTPAQAAAVNGQAERRTYGKPTDYAKSFGMSMGAIARQFAGLGYVMDHQA